MHANSKLIQKISGVLLGSLQPKLYSPVHTRSNISCMAMNLRKRTASGPVESPSASNTPVKIAKMAEEPTKSSPKKTSPRRKQLQPESSGLEAAQTPVVLMSADSSVLATPPQIEAPLLRAMSPLQAEPVQVWTEESMAAGLAHLRAVDPSASPPS